MDGDIAGAGMQQSFAFGLMRDFVGEHDDGIGVADLVHKIPFVAADAFEGRSPLPGSSDIVLLESVHSADESNAHIWLLVLFPCSAPTCCNASLIEKEFQCQYCNEKEPRGTLEDLLKEK